MTTLGERLKIAREQAGLTQQELEAKSGVKQATISKLELGKNKTEETAYGVHLAVACGVRPQWLVLNEGPMLEGLKPDEATLLEKYRGSDNSGKTAIQRVAESLAKPYGSQSGEGEEAA